MRNANALLRAGLCSLVTLTALAACAGALAACAAGRAAGPSANAPASQDDLGVLVMAHGGTAEWNDAVAKTVEPLRAKYPIEIAFGMADATTIQDAVSKLEARHVHRIAVVRLFVSGESWQERTEQILGVRPGAPPADGEHSMHGEHAARGEHSMHGEHAARDEHSTHGEHATQGAHSMHGGDHTAAVGAMPAGDAMPTGHAMHAGGAPPTGDAMQPGHAKHAGGATPGHAKHAGGAGQTGDAMPSMHAAGATPGHAKHGGGATPTVDAMPSMHAGGATPIGDAMPSGHAMHAGGATPAHAMHADGATPAHAMHGMSAGHSMAFFRIATHSSFALTNDGLVDAPGMGKVLADRATALSKDPAHEDVLILAHGPGDDGENARWLAKLDERAAAIRAAKPFRRVQVETLREDWPDKRVAAEARIRAFVKRATDEGGTAIVVPFRVQGFGPYQQVLDGLTYVADGQGLIPHAEVGAWIESEIDALRAGPFRPTVPD